MREHRWSSEGSCRLGRKCSERAFRAGPSGLVCADCRLCFLCAPEECGARRRNPKGSPDPCGRHGVKVVMHAGRIGPVQDVTDLWEAQTGLSEAARALLDTEYPPDHPWWNDAPEDHPAVRLPDALDKAKVVPT
jgi:hypothetical protein